MYRDLYCDQYPVETCLDLAPNVIGSKKGCRITSQISVGPTVLNLILAKGQISFRYGAQSQLSLGAQVPISFGTRPNLIWGQGQIALGPCPALPQISFGPNAQSHFGLRANLSMTLKFIHMSHKCVVLAYWHPCTYKVGVYLSVEPLQYTRAEYTRSTSLINRTYSQTIKCISHLGPRPDLIWTQGSISFGPRNLSQLGLGPDVIWARIPILIRPWA